MRRTDSHEPLQMMPWWVQRWLSSEARAVMTLEQQAAYRNLLDHAWLREDCALPNDQEHLRKLAGASPEEWIRVGPVVLLWFTERGTTLVNIPQHIEHRLALKKRSIARSKGRKAGLKSGTVRRSATNYKFVQKRFYSELGLNPPSPSPSQSTENEQRTTDAPPPAPPPSPPPERLEAEPTATAARRATRKPAASPAEPSWSREATDIWRAAYGGDPKGKFFGGMKPIVDRYGWDRAGPVLAFYCGQTPAEFVSLSTLLSAFGEFEKRSQGNGRVRDGPRRQTAEDVTVQAVQNILRKEAARKGGVDGRLGAVLGGSVGDRDATQPADGRGEDSGFPHGAGGRDG